MENQMAMANCIFKTRIFYRAPSQMEYAPGKEDTLRLTAVTMRETSSIMKQMVMENLKALMDTNTKASGSATSLMG